MSALLFDVKQVFRAIRRQPAFFAIASVTLAIGFAAHLSAFSVVDRMLLAAPAHVQDAEHIVRLHIDRDDRRTGGRFLWFQTPWRSYLDLRDRAGFAAMAAYRPTTASVGSGAEARQLAIVFADEHYFPLLGATPQIGRVFDGRENQPPSGTFERLAPKNAPSTSRNRPTTGSAIQTFHRQTATNSTARSAVSTIIAPVTAIP